MERRLFALIEWEDRLRYGIPKVGDRYLDRTMLWRVATINWGDYDTVERLILDE